MENLESFCFKTDQAVGVEEGRFLKKNFKVKNILGGNQLNTLVTDSSILEVFLEQTLDEDII